MVRTVAGGELKFYPGAISVDRQGTLYIVAPAEKTIYSLTSAGVLTAFAGAGAHSDDLVLPSGIAVGADGSVLVADAARHVIRRYFQQSSSIVAGTGNRGYAGDGFQATKAALDSPGAICVDRDGTIYFADTGNKRIRRIRGSVIETVAGNGSAAFNGDGRPALESALDLSGGAGLTLDPSGDLYIADTAAHRVRKLSGQRLTTIAGTGARSSSGDGGPAWLAGLAAPTSVAVDAGGNIYIAETGRIRRVAGTLSSAVITTFAGTGRPGFNGEDAAIQSAQVDPASVIIAPNGTLYFSDRTGRIREVKQSVAAAPFVRTGGVVNSASGEPRISPGAWFSIYGSNLTDDPPTSWSMSDIVDGWLPTSLSRLSVRVNGKACAIAYTSSTQINAQAPDINERGLVRVEISGPRGSATGTVNLESVSPALFSSISRRTGIAHVVALHSDGNIVDEEASASPGEIVSFYGTGFGSTLPFAPAGRIVEPSPTSSLVAARVGGVDTVVTYSGMVGPGLYQFNVLIPDLPDGEHTVVLEVNNIATAPRLFVSVRK